MFLNGAIAIAGIFIMGFFISFSKNLTHNGIPLEVAFPELDTKPLLAEKVYEKNPIQKLSKKERSMLQELSKGLTNRELSTELGISVNTVKFHLSNLYDKLAVRNRSQAIAYFYSNKHPIEENEN